MAVAKKKAVAIPARIGAAIDALWALREERKRVDAQVTAIKEQETEFEDQIFKKFGKSDLEGARGKAAQASISVSEYPTMTDPAAFYKHLAKTKEFDLLQQRLAVMAIKERWEEKKTVPGIGKFTKVRLSLTKVKVKAK